MVERICGVCGGVWGKSFKFCPSDGSLLVAVDTIVKAEPLRPKRARRSDPAIEVERRRATHTREFSEQSTERQEIPPKPDWTNPVFTLRKSHTAAAFDETACHKRPALDAHGALVHDAVEPKGPKTNPHPRPVSRVGGDMMQ